MATFPARKSRKVQAFDAGMAQNRAGALYTPSAAGGIPWTPPNPGSMPRELASILLRKSVRRMREDEPRCHECGRTPLTGELLHLIEDERVLCSLCLANMPEETREPVSSTRVGAAEKPLAVIRHAA
jgi:hypothetical protein